MCLFTAPSAVPLGSYSPFPFPVGLLPLHPPFPCMLLTTLCQLSPFHPPFHPVTHMVIM